jgi:crossover junction endodeoxyribonuclease RusA
MTTEVAFFVPGKPAAQGSKRHVGRGVLVESSKYVGPWRDRVSFAAHTAMAGRTLLDGPITVALDFVMPRPASTPKRTTPPAVKRPDLDKMTRAILDSITNIIIRDDSQVIDLHATKRLAELGETAGVRITVELSGQRGDQ